MIEKLACSLGRNDEEPNIELAHMLCEENSLLGIKEIMKGMLGKDKAIANDCIKVLYEVGSRKPELIADYVSDFISLLHSKNNRLVWGSMTALAAITELKPEEIFSELEIVKKAYRTGSVITIDQSITLFAKLCRSSKRYEEEIYPMLLDHLLNCRAKEVPQHAERISICVHTENVKQFLMVLDKRKEELSESQRKRICKLVKQINKQINK